MGKKYDVVAITGEYQKEGQNKPIYQTVGVIFEKDGKFYLKMNSLVTVHRDGNVVTFFSLFEPRQQTQNQTTAQNAAPTQQSPDFDDDIPFN